MFGLPTYTYFEDDIVGVVDVTKVGVSTSEIVVFVTGGKSVAREGISCAQVNISVLL